MVGHPLCATILGPGPVQNGETEVLEIVVATQTHGSEPDLWLVLVLALALALALVLI